MYCTKVNDTSTQCVSLYLDVTDVLTAIFRNVLQVFKLFQQKYVFSLALLTNDFYLFCDLFNFKIGVAGDRRLSITYSRELCW